MTKVCFTVFEHKKDGPDHRRVFDAADDPHGALLSPFTRLPHPIHEARQSAKGGG